MCYVAEHIYETTNRYLTLNMSMTVAFVGLSYSAAVLRKPDCPRQKALAVRDEDVRFTMRSAIKTGKHLHECVVEILFKKDFL